MLINETRESNGQYEKGYLRDAALKYHERIEKTAGQDAPLSVSKTRDMERVRGCLTVPANQKKGEEKTEHAV